MIEKIFIWIESKTKLHVHWHKLWNTYPLIFKCRCGDDVKEGSIGSV